MAEFPRWVVGGPNDTSGSSPALLREVASGLYVGSCLSARFVDKNTAVASFSSHCEDCGNPLRMRALFEDFKAVPRSLIESVVSFAGASRGHRPILLQCYAGLNRSASMAYAVLRMVYGMPHASAVAAIAHTVEKHDRTERFPNDVTLGSVVEWCDERIGR